MYFIAVYQNNGTLNFVMWLIMRRAWCAA